MKQKYSITMKQLLVSILACIIYLNLYSQEAKEPTIDTPKSIEEQFDFIYGNSGNYTQYKVIKQDWFNKLKKQTLDSLLKAEKELSVTEQKITSQQVEIKKSEKKLLTLNDELASISEEKDTMPFLGIKTTKKTFSTVVFSIIVLLIVLLVLFIFRFNRSNVITKTAQRNLKDLEVEFEDYRRRALEREQKVMRKLQDELNKKK